MYPCQYCQKSYKTRRSLKIHQETTTKCLRIQNTTPSTYYICEDCNKNYTTKQMLNEHGKSCIQKYKRLLQERDTEIKRLISIRDEHEAEIRHFTAFVNKYKDCMPEYIPKIYEDC
jgi:DNA-directed RNA polymerase subunit RPC12/RpoP